jgi:hypothetical protein
MWVIRACDHGTFTIRDLRSCGQAAKWRLARRKTLKMLLSGGLLISIETLRFALWRKKGQVSSSIFNPWTTALSFFTRSRWSLD